MDLAIRINVHWIVGLYKLNCYICVPSGYSRHSMAWIPDNFRDLRHRVAGVQFYSIIKMERIKIVMENGIVKKWVITNFDGNSYEFPIENDELKVHYEYQSFYVDDLFKISLSELPEKVNITIYIDEEEETPFEFYRYVPNIYFRRNNDEFRIKYYFFQADYQNLKGIPAIELLRYAEILAVQKNNIEITYPYEKDYDTADVGFVVKGDFGESFKDLYNNCNSIIDDLLEEVRKRYDSFTNVLQSHKFQLNLPEEVVVPISQYLLYFNDYVQKAKGITVNMNLIKTTYGVELSFEQSDEIGIDSIKEWMFEYVSFTKQNINDISFPTSINLNENQLSIISLKLKQQISHLQNSLDIIRMENKLLKENSDYLKLLVQNFSNQPIQINNYIKNDSYNFVNEVINSSNLLSSNDQELVRLIYENTSSEEERKELVEDLKKIKDPTASSDEKKKSKSKFKKFMETGLTEVTKQLFKNLIESGFDMII